MSAARRTPAKKPTPPAAPTNQFSQRVFTTVLALIALAALVGVGRWTWYRIGPRVVANEAYQLDPQQISITPQPDWIRADVKAEVLRDASLDHRLPLLSDELTQKIADAFSFHPWVAKVERVTKSYPAHVQVDLIYRQPVVMVSLEGSASLDLIPLDSSGVRLPSSDFSALEKHRLPRLVGIANLPLAGQRSSDPRVLGGAKLAELLGELWQPFSLARIVPVSGGSRFELITHSGTRIIWGAAPGTEPDGEPKADEKVARLRQHIKEHGSLDALSREQLEVDNRRNVPFTASK